MALVWSTDVGSVDKILNNANKQKSFIKLSFEENECTKEEYTSKELDTIFDSANWSKKDQLTDNSPLIRDSFQIKDYCVLLDSIREYTNGVVKLTHPQIIREYFRRYGSKKISVIVNTSVRALSYEWIRMFVETKSVRDILDWEDIVKTIFSTSWDDFLTVRRSECNYFEKPDNTEFRKILRDTIVLLFENRENIGVSTEFMLQCLDSNAKGNRSISGPLYTELSHLICDEIYLPLEDGKLVKISTVLDNFDPSSIEDVNAVKTMLSQKPNVIPLATYIFNKLQIERENVNRFSFLTETQNSSIYKHKYIGYILSNSIESKSMLASYLNTCCKNDEDVTYIVFSLMSQRDRGSDIEMCIEYAKKNGYNINWHDYKRMLSM